MNRTLEPTRGSRILVELHQVPKRKEVNASFSDVLVTGFMSHECVSSEFVQYRKLFE
ncbi:hypothetical protein TUMEXPCC7403_02420 [Tumidithrix helvetica PCC 7403]